MHRGRSTCGVLLLSLLGLALLPRSGVVVHTHPGGDHHHVHLDGESGGTHSHHAVARHSHPHAAEHTRGSFDHGHAHARSDSHAHANARVPFEVHHSHAADDDTHVAGAPQRNSDAVRPLTTTLRQAAVGSAAPHWHAQHPCLLRLPARPRVPALPFSLDRFAPTPPRTHAGGIVALPFARGPPTITVLPTFHA